MGSAVYTAQNEAAQTVSPGRLVGAMSASGAHLLARLGHHGTQLLAGLEDRHWTGGHFDRVSGARVAGHTRLPLPDLERAKPTYLNVMLLGQCRLHGVQERVNDAGAVLLGDEGTGGSCDLCGDLLDQIGLRHPSPLKGPRVVQSRGPTYGLTYCVSRAWRNWRKCPCASCGPGDASGWYWTAKIGYSRCRTPSTVPSLRLRWVTSRALAPGTPLVSPRTAKPWFCDVISTCPVCTSRTGWLPPRWPYGSFTVSPPRASPSSWWPRQIPKIGTVPSASSRRV